MKFLICGLFLSVAFLAQAQEGKEEIKIYKRLIPADILRGKCLSSNLEKEEADTSEVRK